MWWYWYWLIKDVREFINRRKDGRYIIIILWWTIAKERRKGVKEFREQINEYI